MALRAEHEAPVQAIRDYHSAPRKLPGKVFGALESGSVGDSSNKDSTITELPACLLPSILRFLMAVTILDPNLSLYLLKEYNSILQTV